MKTIHDQLSALLIIGLCVSMTLLAKNTFYSQFIDQMIKKQESMHDSLAGKQIGPASLLLSKRSRQKPNLPNQSDALQIESEAKGSITGQVLEKSYTGIECYRDVWIWDMQLVAPIMGGRVGDTLIVPVRIENLEESVFSMELTLNLDDALAFEALDVSGGLIGEAGWAVQFHAVGKQVHIAAAGAAPIQFEGEYYGYNYGSENDTLFCVRLVLLETEFKFATVTLSDALLNTGSPVPELAQGGIYISQDEVIIPVQGYISIDIYNAYGLLVKSKNLFGDDGGMYQISDIPSGDYYVIIDVYSYKTTFFNNAQNWQEAALVTVVSGQETSGINFILEETENIQAKGCIAGIALNAEGNPVYDCCVFAYSELFSAAGGAYTDIYGNYCIEGLKTDDYRVQAQYKGTENYMDVWYKDKELITVNEPDTVKDIDFILQPGGIISGWVLAPSGSSAGQDYEVTAYSTTDEIEKSVHTDITGYFKIQGLPPGYYTIAAHDNYDDYPETWYNGTISSEDAAEMAVTAGDEKVITIRFLESGKITGIIYRPDGSRIETSDGMIYVYDLNHSIEDICQTDYDGSFEISRLCPGRYKLFFESWAGSIPGPASGWYGKAHDFEFAKIIEVLPGQTTVGVNVTLDWGGAISGRISGPEGPLPDQSGRVVLYDMDGYEIEHVYFLFGRYTLYGVLPGEYKLKFQYEGEDDFCDCWYGGATCFKECASVSVPSFNSLVTGIDFSLEYACHIQGFVVDQRGYRLSSDSYPNLTVYLLDALSRQIVADDEISFAGGYDFKINEGQYKLFYTSQYIDIYETPQDSLVSTFYKGGFDFGDSSSLAITVDSGNIIELDDLVMTSVSSGISGRVQADSADSSFTDLYFGVCAIDQNGISVKMSMYFNSSGEYFISGVRPGTYYLLAFKASDFLGTSVVFWYGGTVNDWEGLPDVSSFVEIPDTAIPVTVTENQITDHIDILFSPTGLDNPQESKMPDTFCLCQNYPNPFNPSTTIRYELSRATPVQIAVYNLLGQQVEALVDKEQTAGIYQVQWNSSSCPSGIYFYSIQAGEFSATKKLLLLK